MVQRGSIRKNKRREKGIREEEKRELRFSIMAQRKIGKKGKEADVHEEMKKGKSTKRTVRKWKEG